MIIDKTLRDNNITLSHQQEGNQKVKCPQCQPPHNPRDNPLSVTITNDSVVWKCHHCEWTGGKGTGYIYEPKRKTSYTRPSPPIAPEKPQASFYEYMKERKISRDTCERYKVVQENEWCAFQYFDELGELTNVKYRTRDKKFRQSANAKSILYNYDRVCGSDVVIFTEGEFDVLALAEVGFAYGTTLPNGAPKEFKGENNDKRFSALENCKLTATKVILFTDNDDSGKALHKELLHRFGKDICWFVEIPDNCKDANEVLIKHGPMKLREIVELAIPYPIEGLYTARDYFSQLNDLYEGDYEKPTEIGMDGLDDIYKIMTGTFHVITGIPNHGKSVFLDQILINLAEKNGWRFALFSPEHSTSMHIRRLVQMFIQKPFDEGMKNRMTKTELHAGLDFINKHFFFIETKDAIPSIELILSVAKSAVYKHGINGLVIDPFNEVSAVRQGNQREDEHIRDFISLCKRFTRVYEIVCWVIAHPTKLPKTNEGNYLPPTAYDISGASHWHNQSDAVLTVHRDFEDNSTNVITRKIREQDLYGKIGECKFKYNTERRCFEKYNDIEDVDWDTAYLEQFNVK